MFHSVKMYYMTKSLCTPDCQAHVNCCHPDVYKAVICQSFAVFLHWNYEAQRLFQHVYKTSSSMKTRCAKAGVEELVPVPQ